MVKCPECGEEINYLNAYSREENKQAVGLFEGDILEWDLSETIEDTCDRIEFECPECGKIIYTNEGNSQDEWIINFLKGGDETTRIKDILKKQIKRLEEQYKDPCYASMMWKLEVQKQTLEWVLFRMEQ